MKKSFYSDTVLIFIVILSSITSVHHAYILYMEEGDLCVKSDGNSPGHFCKRPENCSTLEYDISNQMYPPICTFLGKVPVVCCSPSVDFSNRITPIYDKPVVSSYTAAEMCQRYSELAYRIVKNPVYTGGKKTDDQKYLKILDCFNVMPLIYGGTTAKPKEFPHMALIGYGDKSNQQKTWGCGGSLISNRWILSAAHCAINNEKPASWVRLGDISKYSTNDDPNSKFYDIVEAVVHPKYDRSYVYNDIALFRLGTEVAFSAYIRPTCLNTDSSFNFKTASATGWGRIRIGGPTSPDLLKIDVKPIAIDQCKHSYPPTWHPRINLGILQESMICMGDFEDGSDTCSGDSGGPLQIPNSNYSCMYTQVGITSFGKYCGSIDTPGIYTRVSNYIKWIEPIVWPKI